MHEIYFSIFNSQDFLNRHNIIPTSAEIQIPISFSQLFMIFCTSFFKTEPTAVVHVLSVTKFFHCLISKHSSTIMAFFALLFELIDMETRNDVIIVMNDKEIVRCAEKYQHSLCT